jgi:hypothetical protein
MKAVVPGDSRKHPGTNHLAILGFKDIVVAVCVLKGPEST